MMKWRNLSYAKYLPNYDNCSVDSMVGFVRHHSRWMRSYSNRTATVRPAVSVVLYDDDGDDDCEHDDYSPAIR